MENVFLNIRRSYKSASRGPVYEYIVTGPKHLIEKYLNHQGMYARKQEDGLVLFFTQRSFGASAEVPLDRILT